MIVATLLILGASLTFLSIAFIAVLFCIVLPMREDLARTNAERDELRTKQEAQQRRQDEQEDTIARNAGASIGLYMATCRELHALQNKVAFVEAYTVPMLPEDNGPTTEKSPGSEARS